MQQFFYIYVWGKLLFLKTLLLSISILFFVYFLDLLLSKLFDKKKRYNSIFFTSKEQIIHSISYHLANPRIKKTQHKKRHQTRTATEKIKTSKK